MKPVETFIATIHVGSKNMETMELVPLEVGEKCVQDFVNEVSQCFSVTRTEYIYKNGREPGLIVGAINYPRFPSKPRKLTEQTLALANRLRKIMKQNKITIVFSDFTHTLGEDK